MARKRMNRLLILCSLLLILPSQQSKFVKTKISDRITTSLPIDFFIVPEVEMASKFISYRNPIAVYTDVSTKIDFVVNTSLSKWLASDIEIMQSFYKANISSIYDKVDFLSERIEIINKREFVVFEFISTILPNDNSIRNEPTIIRYNYLQYTIVQGETFLFNFNTPRNQKERWEKIAAEIMHSIKIK